MRHHQATSVKVCAENAAQFGSRLATELRRIGDEVGVISGSTLEEIVTDLVRLGLFPDRANSDFIRTINVGRTWIDGQTPPKAEILFVCREAPSLVKLLEKTDPTSILGLEPAKTTSASL